MSSAELFFTMVLVVEMMVIVLAAIFVLVLVRFVPVRVMETQIDPPPNAHYIIMRGEGGEPDPETLDAIRTQKIAEIFYHALAFNDGYCSVRTLHKIIAQQWNSHYEKYPEYKKHWLISRVMVEEVVIEYDYLASGRVIQLSATEAAEPRPVAYVLLPAEQQGNITRRLYAVADLVSGFLPPTVTDTPQIKEKIVKAAVIPSVETLPKELEKAVGGVLVGGDTLPAEPQLNGYHTAEPWD
jgi:hypothetical protein